jgi:glutamate-1-semialdehyde 2,1-aminomutase
VGSTVTERADLSLNAWAVRASRVVPGGASTGSKRPDALFGEAVTSTTPTHMRRAFGCRVETADGRVLIDLTMALGAVALGYADPEVTEAVQEAAAAGPVSGLSPLLEIEVAERLTEVVPCAEQVRFLKTGAEATAAAIRLARAHTGRDVIIASGYFGWHDWSNPGPGVPHSAFVDVRTVPFNDMQALHQAVRDTGERLAGIIVEPLVHDVASAEWLRAARAYCDQLGAVLIFDEIKTAFRMHQGGVQALCGVIPDLTTLGKALANGYPLSAVVGRASVMSSAKRAWISSTLASEMTALAATRVVLARHARTDVCGALAKVGTKLQHALTRALAPHALSIRVEGPPQMLRLACDNSAMLDALVVAATAEGVLLKRGAYQFAALAHDDAALASVESAVHAAALRVRAS